MAVVVGAVISGVIGVSIVLLQQWIQHRRDTRNETARRLASFSAACWVTTLDLGGLARASGDEKARLDLAMADNRNAVLEAMAQIQILDDQQVYDAAIQVDRELTQLLHIARTETLTREQWRERRAFLTPAVLRFQADARRALRKRKIELQLPSGDALELP